MSNSKELLKTLYAFFKHWSPSFIILRPHCQHLGRLCQRKEICSEKTSRLQPHCHGNILSAWTRLLEPLLSFSLSCCAHRPSKHWLTTLSHTLTRPQLFISLVFLCHQQWNFHQIWAWLSSTWLEGYNHHHISEHLCIVYAGRAPWRQELLWNLLAMTRMYCKETNSSILTVLQHNLARTIQWTSTTHKLSCLSFLAAVIQTMHL